MLHAFYSHTAEPLKRWIGIRPRNALTVLDTHDGIGIIDIGADGADRAAHPGLVPDHELDQLVERIHLSSRGHSRRATGAAASNLDLYQVNCTFYDALGCNDRAYLLARAIQFFLPGVPQVYYVGLLAGENDMALLSAFTTSFDFANTGADAQPYTIYPQAHVVAMEAKAQVKNKGYMAQTNVVSTINIDGPGTDDFTWSAAPTDVDASVVYDQIFDVFQPNGDPGAYQVTFTTTQTEADDIPTNNTLTRDFSVSGNVYALDNGVVESFQRQSPDNLAEVYEVGSKFQFQVDDQITDVQVAIHGATPAGGLIYGAVYDLAPDNTSHPSLRGDFTTEHTIDASELNDVGGSNFITMHFVNPIDVVQGDVVQVMAGTFQASDSVRFATSGFLPLQIALIHYPNLDQNMEFTFTKAPMVRAVLASGPIGIPEQDGLVNVVKAGPNPFSTVCDLRFELARASKVRVELLDGLGRVAIAKDLGELSAGQQLYRVDGTALAAGLYQYSVTINGIRHTGKLQRME